MYRCFLAGLVGDVSVFLLSANLYRLIDFATTGQFTYVVTSSLCDYQRGYVPTCSIDEPGVQRRLRRLKRRSQGFCVERIIADVNKQEAIRHSLCA